MVNVFWKKFIQGFYFASEGIVYTVVSQRNMKIHIFFALSVLLISMMLHISGIDAVMVILAIGIVISAEIFNTAIESAVNLMTKDVHPLAKAAKDAAAGGVLFIVFAAILLGIIVIFPYIQFFYSERWGILEVDPPSFFALQGLFLFIFTYVVKALWVGYGVGKDQPHVMVGLFLQLLILAFFYVPVFAYLMLAILIPYFLYLFKKGFTFIGFLQNIVISAGGSFLIYWLFYD